MRKRMIIGVVACLLFCKGFAQNILHSDLKILAFKVNSEPIERWELAPEINPDIMEIECTREENTIAISGGKNMLTFKIKKGDKVDFEVRGENQTAHVRIVGVEPNVRFTEEYIKAHRGKVIAQIPEVSELVNILMVLHKDAEKDRNMFDTEKEYYKRVKAHFAPFRNHPAIDTIQKYITTPQLNRQHQVYLFPRESYTYYYALKMNAVEYEFDKQGNIVSKGQIGQVAKSWNAPFDPMKDVSVFQDFAKKSNFRKFYADNKPYYDELLSTYNRLNPIGQMQKWLDKKFGFSYDSYMIFFSPLNKGAQAATHFQKGDFKQTFMFVCKVLDDANYSDKMNELLASWIVFTEIDHNYVNPVSDKMLESINKAFSNRDKWAFGEVTEVYPNPYDVFNEYMTFALFTLYANDFYSEAEVMKFLPMYEPMMENTRGFIRFKDFNRTLLAKYRENPHITMLDLYAYILDWATKQNQD